MKLKCAPPRSPILHHVAPGSASGPTTTQIEAAELPIRYLLFCILPSALLLSSDPRTAEATLSSARNRTVRSLARNKESQK